MAPRGRAIVATEEGGHFWPPSLLNERILVTKQPYVSTRVSVQSRWMNWLCTRLSGESLDLLALE